MNDNEKEPIVEPEDIPEVEIKNKKITLGTTTYKLIMAYICPICKKPLVAYWTVDKQERATDNIVGRALRDSGFGGYRFFESENGQGFEYDLERDPRKRHQHGKRKETYYGPGEYEEMWNNYIKLNPVFSVNELFHDLFEIFSYKFNEKHMFVIDQDIALRIVDNITTKNPEIFKKVEDIIGHGKPLLFFNITPYYDATGRAYNDQQRWDALLNIIDRVTLRLVDLDTLELYLKKENPKKIYDKWKKEYYYKADEKTEPFEVQVSIPYTQERKAETWIKSLNVEWGTDADYEDEECFSLIVRGNIETIKKVLEKSKKYKHWYPKRIGTWAQPPSEIPDMVKELNEYLVTIGMKIPEHTANPKEIWNKWKKEYYYEADEKTEPFEVQVSIPYTQERNAETWIKSLQVDWGTDADYSDENNFILIVRGDLNTVKQIIEQARKNKTWELHWIGTWAQLPSKIPEQVRELQEYLQTINMPIVEIALP